MKSEDFTLWRCGWTSKLKSYLCISSHKISLNCRPLQPGPTPWTWQPRTDRNGWGHRGSTDQNRLVPDRAVGSWSQDRTGPGPEQIQKARTSSDQDRGSLRKFQTPGLDPTRTSNILKISDRFGPVGPRPGGPWIPWGHIDFMITIV